MKPHEVKRLRTQSLLKEMLGEALANLNDPLLAGLLVIDVELKKGKYDAFVYLDKEMYDEKEQEFILAKLKKAHPAIKDYILNASSWFRSPNFHFAFDDNLEKINKIEALFAQIAKEKKDES